MGKKLTYSERAQRDREKEARRVSRAKEVAKRRAGEKKVRDDLLKRNVAAAESEAKKYENFYNSLINLHNKKSLGAKTFNKVFSEY